MNLEHLTSNLALLGFALASVLYLVAVQAGAAREWAGRAAFGLFVAATACVTAALGTVIRDASSLDMSGLLLACFIGWLSIFGHLQFKMRLIGAFVAPLTTLILILHFFISPTTASTATGEAGGVLLTGHVAAAVLGIAFACIACAVSILYLWQQNLLKKKRLDQLGAKNLPAIDRLDFVLKLSLWSGFLFLTLGLLSGAIWVQMYSPPPELRLSAKVIWSVAVWVWYLAILLAKNVFSRPSKRIAQMSLVGFLLLALSFFGMGFYRGGA